MDHRFYGRRSGRSLTAYQRKIMDDLCHEVYETKPDHPLRLLNEIFQKDYEGYGLEIGFGGGEHLAGRSAAMDHWGFLGCEAFINGVASAFVHIHEQSLKNIRIYPNDVRPFLPLLPDHSFDVIDVMFPDPWPKLRHHKRRLIQKDFLKQCHRLLKPTGYLRIASDHEGYVDWIRYHLENTSDFSLHSYATIHPEDMPMTRYEQKALQQGHTCHYFSWISR